ncbi:unnamed protein product, partial [marine sediment metagenome]
FEKSIDNVDYPKTHTGSKTLLYRKELEITPENLKYSRLFYHSCNSANYFIDNLNRGVMFYTTNASAMLGGTAYALYLGDYFDGKSDEQIWETLQSNEAVFDYYNFTQAPPASAPPALPMFAKAAVASPPDVYIIDPEQEQKIQALKNLTTKAAFDVLKDTDFLLDEALLLHAIPSVFEDNKAEAIALALKQIKLPLIKNINGKIVNRQSDFYVAKKILQAFAADAVDDLLELYENSDTLIRGNAIRASGGLLDDETIENMLIL